MRALAGIALNTFREAMRQVFFYVLVAVGAAMLLVTLVVPLFTFYNDTDMYKDVGLSFALVFVLLAGLLAAATGVAREVEDKTAQTILAKAVGRWQFVLGKYAGAMGAVAVAAGVMGTVLAAAVYYRVEMDLSVLEHARVQGGIGAAVTEMRERQLNQALTVLPGMVLIFLQVAVLAAVATALSTRFSTTASVGLALVAFVAGHLTAFLEGAVRATGGAARAAADGVVAVVPFLEIFNINPKLSHTILTPLASGGPGLEAWWAVWAYVGWAALYALAYVAMAIGAGVLLFRRRALA
jgi:ABC-type transport system involved in multi-copper enzyme maturation permease subunit